MCLRSEFETSIQIIEGSTIYREALAELHLPDYLDVVIEPWPYGSLESSDEPGRYFQGLLFGKDTRSGNPDTNFYPFPIPMIVIVDYYNRKVTRTVKLATGGVGDSMTAITYPKNAIDHCKPAEYVPELLPHGPRKDLRDLSVLQPDGPSFNVSDDNLVEWQRWRFRVGWTPREGAVIHDVHYEGRSVFYRLSISELVTLYSDLFQLKEKSNVSTARLSPTPIQDLHITGSRPLISAKEARACVQTIWLLAAIA